MSTPSELPARGQPTARPNPNPTPMIHGGRPDGGMHVPSAVDGAGGYDCSGAVGSNIAPGPAGSQASDDVLDAPPRTGAYPGAGILNNPSGY